MDLGCYDLLSTAVLLLDEQGRIQHVNVAAEELFDLSRRQLKGVRAQQLFTGLASVQGGFRQDVVLQRGSASVPVSVTVVPLENQPWAILLEARTTEDHILLERQRQIDKELAVHRESLRNLAHEVKNPLGGIRGAAQLLQAELPSASLHEYTQVIIAEVDRLGRLVDQLISPREGGATAGSFNVHELCERVHALLRAEFGDRIELVRDYDASAPEVHADFSRLLQALLNLARNGAQAVTENILKHRPQLILRTRIGRPRLLVNPSAGMCVIVSVLDNGPGVPTALREKIFHPLVTGRAEGTGLGLSLAQELVRQQGGQIEFSSRPGQTEFRMIVPLEQTP